MCPFLDKLQPLVARSHIFKFKYRIIIISEDPRRLITYSNYQYVLLGVQGLQRSGPFLRGETFIGRLHFLCCQAEDSVQQTEGLLEHKAEKGPGSVSVSFFPWIDQDVTR